MKILIITGRFHGPGGTETFVRNICRGFIARGHDVTVVSHQRFSERRPSQKAKFFNVFYTFPSFHIPRIPMSYLPAYIIAKWLAVSRVGAQKYDVVNAQGELEGFCALRARSLLKCPITLRIAGIWHPVTLKEIRDVYGDGFLTKSIGQLVELMEREVLKNSDAISTLNEQQKEIMVNEYNVQSEKVHVIPHGIDADAFNPKIIRQFRDEMRNFYHLDAPVILFVGRLAPIKRVDLLIEALAILVKDIPSVKLVLIGPPSYRDINFYRAQAERLGVEKSLVYIGEAKHEEIAHYMAMCDVYADVSEEYGIGFSTLEAMSCGLPVVSTRTEEGTLKVNYSAQDIAEALRIILTDATRARTLGERARKHIEEAHGFEKMVDDYIDFFKGVLREKE